MSRKIATGAAPAGLEAPVNKGRRFFFTGRARWANEAWSSCGSCHGDGLSDNVTWRFAAGPRHPLQRTRQPPRQADRAGAQGGRRLHRPGPGVVRAAQRGQLRGPGQRRRDGRAREKSGQPPHRPRPGRVRRYNIPSLYGLALGAPYLHHGQAKTLAELFTDPKWSVHLRAGNAVFTPSAGRSKTSPTSCSPSTRPRPKLPSPAAPTSASSASPELLPEPPPG